MTIKHPLTPEDFKTIYSKVPRINVEILLKTSKGLLLSKRSIEPCIGQWHIPGGTIYFGESIEQAAKRVARDELGIEIELIKEVGHIEYPVLHKDGYYGWPIGIALEVRIVSGQPRGSEQGEEIRFFKTLPDNTITDQAKFIKDNQILL